MLARLPLRYLLNDLSGLLIALQILRFYFVWRTMLFWAKLIFRFK